MIAVNYHNVNLHRVEEFAVLLKIHGYDIIATLTLSAEKLAEQMRQAGAKTVLIERKPRRAVALAAKRFGQTPTVITGSLYLCADIRDRLPRLYKI